MSILRRKRYKALPPEKTIEMVFDIIKDSLGVNLRAQSFEKVVGQFYSCRMVLENGWIEDYNLGVNGKGVSKEYALASGCGEIMERIQNRAILRPLYSTMDFIEEHSSVYPQYTETLHNEGLVSKFRLAPDETIVTDPKVIKESLDKYLSPIPETVKESIAANDITFVPFYNLTNGCVEDLPIGVITNFIGTNGMCAGNTPKEALIQGLCEVVERYVLREIYSENITPPTISKELFSGNDIYNRLVELEQELGFDIEIKDCSCGKGFPAIGVLMVDKQKQRYQFHIGVDPSPITALERSLTEIFQGRSELYFHDIDFDYQSKLLTDCRAKQAEFTNTVLTSTGTYPISILSPDNSYEFGGFDYRLGQSDDYDFNYLISIINSLGLSIYIRDVSFLGFPAYRIYIPTMSEIFNIYSLDYLESSYKRVETLYEIANNLHTASTEEIKCLISYYNTGLNNEAFNIYNLNSLWRTQDKDYIFAVLNYRIGDADAAMRHIAIATRRSQGKQRQFFKAIYDYIFQRKCGNKCPEALLKITYDVDLISRVIKLLESKEWYKVFDENFEQECNEFSLPKSSHQLDYLRIVRSIEECYIRNIPQQENLKKLLM